MADDARVVTGLKLLGLYFGIRGLAALAGSVPALVATGAPPIGVVVALTTPVVQLVAGIALVFRTATCARLCRWG